MDILNQFRDRLRAPETFKLLSVFVDQVFWSITNLLTAIVLARTYDKTDYAELILLFSITMFIWGFQNSLVSTPYAINLNDYTKGERNKYYNFNVYLKLVFTLAIIIIFPILYYFLFDTLRWDKLFFYGIYVIGYTFYFFIRPTLLSERKTRLNLIYGLSCSCSLISLLLYVFFTKNANINFFLGISTAIYLTTTSFYFWNHMGWIKIAKQDFLQFFYSNWKVGKWLVGSNLFFHLSTSIYPWLLLYITTKNDIAVFGVLTSAAAVINPVLKALDSYLLPIFVKANLNYTKLNAMAKKWTLLFGVMALTLVVTGYFLGQDIILLLFGRKYANLGILVVYPFIFQAINIFFQPFRISLNAIKRTDVNFYILIPRSIIAILLGYYFITNYGLEGVFYGMIIENLFYQVLQYLIYRKLIRGTRTISPFR